MCIGKAPAPYEDPLFAGTPSKNPERQRMRTNTRTHSAFVNVHQEFIGIKIGHKSLGLMLRAVM